MASPSNMLRPFSLDAAARVRYPDIVPYLHPNQQALVRRAYNPTPHLTAWQRNRAVLENMCSAIGIPPSEPYLKSTPYMSLAAAIAHWAGETYAIHLTTQAFPAGNPIVIATTARYKTETAEALAMRFADHWRSTGFDPFVLSYPAHLAREGHENIEADTTGLRDAESAGLDRERIYWSFLLAPGSAAEARTMMLDGVPEEYIRAALGSHNG